MDLDIGRMEDVLPLFLGVHPFDQFSHKDTGECDIKSFSITENPLSCWEEALMSSGKLPVISFEIEGNRFLHRMVRMIIGAVTEVGRGKIGEDEIKASLELKGKKHLCAPACGLCLREVRY
jgi:tRNA pseudouridine38-40 synthase